jgi:ligand-binding sensor domain-containing protein
LPIKAYTAADGLAHNHINRIRQDSRGFMWFCTDEGLSRFDGSRFINYGTKDGLPHPWVNDLLESRDGTYWVATDGGVCLFRPKRSRASDPIFVTYLPDQDPGSRRVNALAEDASGSIWCATYNGLYRLERSAGSVTFRYVDVGLTGDPVEPRLVNDFSFDQSGTLWIAARTGLYRRLRDGSAERYTTHQGLPENFIGTVVQDRGGRLWISTRDHGFCSLRSEPDPLHVIERCFSVRDGLPHNDVRSILQSSDGKMWIGTVGGLSEFVAGQAEGTRFRNYTTANGLSEIQVYQLAEDRDGNLWVGTRRGGVMKMARHGFVSYGETDGFRSGTSHRSIFESASGKLCVLTSTGPGGIVQRFDGHRFSATAIRFPNPSPGFHVERGLQDRFGEWWMATRQGMVRFPRTERPEELRRIRPVGVYTKAEGLADNSVSEVHKDSRGIVWFATVDVNRRKFSLSRWSRSTRQLENYLGDGASVPTALEEDGAGGFWIGFHDEGRLLRFDGASFVAVALPPESIQGAINSLHLDGVGRLWIASTVGGLVRVDGPASSDPSVSRYTTENGLASNEILCLVEDRAGRIYAGTNRGVDRLDPTSGLIRHYTTADGLSRGAVGLAYRDHMGVLWFVTDEGISRLVPAPEPEPSPTAAIVTGLRIRGVPRPIHELGETQLDQLELAPDQNQVQIDFVGLDFRPGADLRYQYKLESVDRDWSPPTSERTVNYASLAPGSYRFLLRAVSAEGISSPIPAVVRFTILPPLWRRWWCIGLELLVTGCLIYAMYGYRVRRLVAVERIRTRIATDLHDDIGASLSQIAVLSEVARSEAACGEHADEPLARIAGIARELVDNMSEIVWAVNPRKDRFRDLVWPEYWICLNLRLFPAVARCSR